MDSFIAVAHRSLLRRAAFVMVTVAALCAAGPAGAQTQTVDQRLDSVTVFGQAGATGKARGVVQTPMLEQVYYSANPLTPNVEIPLQGTHTLRACQNTGTRGLYCLDYDPDTAASVVLRWQNPDKAPMPATEVSCDDLGLVDCTAMTVNLAGHIFLAGQQTANDATSWVLVKLTERIAGNCPGEDDAETDVTWDLSSGDYCGRAYATGRPKIVDVVMVDGTLANGFDGQGPGVLALEGTNQIAFYADRQPLAAPVVYLATQDFNGVLSNGEVLQGLSLLQAPLAGGNPRNFLMTTTSLGRVMGFETGGRKVFYTGLTLSSTTLAVTDPAAGGTSCTAVAPFDLSTSARTRRTFFSSGNCVAGYDPVIASNVNAKVPVTFTKRFSLGVESSLALSGVAVSPGIEIDFIRDRCIDPLPGGCNLIGTDDNSNDIPAAKFARIQLGNDASGWVMYQVTGIPDCRYLDPKPAICTPGTIVDPTNSGDPTKQYLNVTPLMPPEITQAVTLPTQMLLQPDYQARPTSPGRAAYTFDALFGIPEFGLSYRDTFDGLFDVFDLMGSALGCGGGTLGANAKSAPAWDAIVNISELAPTVGGPVAKAFPEGNPPQVVPREFVSMLLNADCTNPTKLAGTRGSGFFYGLQRAPQAKDAQGNWIWYDSTFAILMRSLARDFDANLYTYTCRNLDDPDGTLAPVSAADCYQLQKDWVVTYDKLKKCVNATDQPKNSSGSEACSSFETQWAAFRTEVDGVTLQPGALDPQNRSGELWARWLVMDYVYRTQFKTSLKRGGFTNPNLP